MPAHTKTGLCQPGRPGEKPRFPATAAAPPRLGIACEKESFARTGGMRSHIRGMIDTVSDTSLPAEDFKKTRRRPAPKAVVPLDRLPPHSVGAEQGVLGCALLDPNTCLPLCVEKLQANAKVFYDLRHQTIYETLLAMFDRRETIDLITVQQRLKDRGALDQIGGIVYLNALQDAVPSTANLGHYTEIVEEKFLLRQLIQVCTETVGKIHEHQGELNALLDEVERDILRVGQNRAGGRTQPMQQLVSKAIDNVEVFFQRQGQLTGLATGFPDLDRMTDGLHGGEMVVIAARPSMGKTSLAMNIAAHVAISQKLPVGVFSLEMTAESLVLRMLCSNARVNLRSIREGFMSESDFAGIARSAGEMSQAPLHIDDTPGLSVFQLRTRARRLWQQHGIKLFVIDYLQLLNSTSRRAQDNRQQEIAEISSGLKALAKELNVPVIVLAQLNRDVEKDKSRKPRMSDLRESGSIEQDADLVGLLYKPNSEEDDVTRVDEGGEGLAINLLIAKQRNGPTGDVPLTFLKQFTRFESAARVGDEDLPE